MKLYIDSIEAGDLGHIVFAVSDKGLRLVSFGRYKGLVDILEHACNNGFQTDTDKAKTQPIGDQIKNYLEGRLKSFETELDIDYLPPFRRKALRAAFKIPFGRVITYGELARNAGSPKASRAAGQAMATNPIPIVIPCHRVVGSDGHLTGYSGGDGIDFKRRLLEMEGVALNEMKVAAN